MTFFIYKEHKGIVPQGGFITNLMRGENAAKEIWRLGSFDEVANPTGADQIASAPFEGLVIGTALDSAILEKAPWLPEHLELDIIAEMEDRLDTISPKTAEKEYVSWSRQVELAKAYMDSGVEGSLPFLCKEGQTVDQLVARILINSRAYEEVSFKIMGIARTLIAKVRDEAIPLVDRLAIKWPEVV